VQYLHTPSLGPAGDSDDFFCLPIPCPLTPASLPWHHPLPNYFRVLRGVRTRSQLVRMALEGSLGAARDLANRARKSNTGRNSVTFR
jgi:hypothetical protein